MNIEMLTAVVVFGGLLVIALIGLTLSNRKAERMTAGRRPADMTSQERMAGLRVSKDTFPPVNS